MKQLNLTGQRFGKLMVIRRCGSKNGHSAWLCRCDCGKEKIISASSLKSGTRSCGCLWSERISEWNHSEKKKRITAAIKTTHGMKGTRIYRIWQAMKARCKNTNVPCFQYYGSRGITVCNEWLNNFQAFYDWAIKNGYSDELTIDRIDVNGNYEPSNCRWVSMAEQNKNKRRRKKKNGIEIKESDIS